MGGAGLISALGEAVPANVDWLTWSLAKERASRRPGLPRVSLNLISYRPAGQASKIPSHSRG